MSVQESSQGKNCTKKKPCQSSNDWILGVSKANGVESGKFASYLAQSSHNNRPESIENMQIRINDLLQQTFGITLNNSRAQVMTSLGKMFAKARRNGVTEKNFEKMAFLLLSNLYYNIRSSIENYKNNVAILSNFIKQPSMTEKKILLPAFVAIDAKSFAGLGIFSAAAVGESKEEPVGPLYYLLLKRLKQFPEMLFDSKSEYTESSENGKGRKSRSSKVTREMRSRMRKKIEKERQEWPVSDDETTDIELLMKQQSQF